MTDWNNEEKVLAAVLNNGWVLQYASPELQNNEKIVLAAVSNDGYTLKYASEELRNNKKIVLAAVSNDGLALQFASPSLQYNRRFCSSIFTREFKDYEFYVIRKNKIYDFKFNLNSFNIKTFKDILTGIF